MTPADIAQLLTRMSMVWPNYKLPTDPETLSLLIQTWGDLLDGITLEQSTQAIRSLAAEGREFAPQPGLVRRRAKELTGVGTVPTAAQAWEEVLWLIARRGWARPPLPEDFSHPAVAETVDSMGWQALCESTTGMADRAHFMKFYAERADRHLDHMKFPTEALQQAIAAQVDLALSAGECEDQDPYE
jgi:hypothetical protein